MLKTSSRNQDSVHRQSAQRAMGSGDWLTAQSEYAAVLAQNCDDAEALINLAVVFLNTQRIDVAIIAARRSVEVKPRSAPAWSNLGYILGTAGQFEECESALRRAIELDPQPEMWRHLGLALYMRGRFSESVAAYDEALKTDPDNVDAIDKRGLSHLGLGLFKQGLTDNRVRWNHLAVHPLMHSPLPEWNDGEPIDGKSIMVLDEQGFGDTLQFVRLVPRLKRMGAKRVVLSIRSELIDLLKVSKLADEVIGVRDEPQGGLGTMDCKCPMQTLAARLDLTIETIPNASYLAAPLRKPLLKHDKKFKVGLVWAGKPMYAQDQWRSMHVQQLMPLLSNRNVSFYSMQVDVPPGQELWRSGMNAFVTDLAPHIKTWADSAALMNELDLLVSADTAPAHLAGGMGKPVALMIPQASCWRWLGHETTTTPWYPSMKLFRQQKQGDWTGVVESVGAHIKSLTAA